MTTENELEGWLREVRRDLTPDGPRAKRVYEAVLASVAVPATGIAGHALMSKASASAVGSSQGGVLAQLLAVAGAKTWIVGITGALALSAGAGVWALSSSSESRSTRGTTTSTHEPVPASPRAARTARAGAPEGTSTSDAPPAATDVKSAPRAALPPLAPPAAPPAKGRAALPLRDELARVRAAQQALDSGDPNRALALLGELDALGGGDLREERSALRVLARCDLEAAARAELLRGFLEKYPASAYGRRLRARCGDR